MGGDGSNSSGSSSHDTTTTTTATPPPGIRFVLQFSHMHLQFWLPELESLLDMLGVKEEAYYKR